MIDDDQHAERFPLRAAFEDYRPAPRDIVPRAHAEHAVDDLRRLADGSAQVTVTHYELTEAGVAEYRETVTIAHPIMPKDENH